MRTRVGIAAVVAIALGLIAGTSYATGAMNPTNGLDIYYLQTAGTGGTFSSFHVYRAHIDPGWTLASANVLVDNITAEPSSTGGWGLTQTYFNKTSPTMFTPKADPFTGAPTGGAGTLTLLAHVPGELSAGGAGWQYPWAILNVTPNAADPTNVANYSFLSKGTLGDGWNESVYTNGLVAAPQNLGGKTSNGIALWIRDPYNGTSHYLYDANNNGLIDNNTTAGMSEAISMGGADITKPSWGPDRAFYKVGGLSNGHPGVSRQYLLPTGTASANSDFADLTNLAASYAFLSGTYSFNTMAVGPSHTAGAGPVVYFALTTTTSDERNSVIALQDLNGDNAIDGTNDLVKILWRSGDLGTSISFDDYKNDDASISDMRYDSVSQSLILTNAWGAIVVLSLDNTTGTDLTGALALGGTQSGYLGGGNRIALDPTPFPAAIPEPATLLLGTGALGVVGWMRRRSMR